MDQDSIKVKRNKKKDKQIEKFDRNGKYTTRSIRHRHNISGVKSTTNTTNTTTK